MVKRFKKTISAILSLSMILSITACTGGGDSQTEISGNAEPAVKVSSIEGPKLLGDKLGYDVVIEGKLYTEKETIQSFTINKATVEVISNGFTKPEYTNVYPLNVTVPVTHDKDGKGTGQYSGIELNGIEGYVNGLGKNIKITIHVESNDGEYSDDFTTSISTEPYNEPEPEPEPKPIHIIKPVQTQYIINENAQALQIPIYVIDDKNRPVVSARVSWAVDNTSAVSTNNGTLVTNNLGYAKLQLNINKNDSGNVRNITLNLLDVSNNDNEPVVINIQQNYNNMDKQHIVLSQSDILVDSNEHDIKIVAKITNDNGSPLTNVPVSFIANINDITTPTEGNVTSDDKGQVIIDIHVNKNKLPVSRTVNYTIYTNSETQQFVIEQSGFEKNVLSIINNNFTIDKNGHTIDLMVKLTDPNGDALSGEDVRIKRISGGFVTPEDNRVTTDGFGLATFELTINENETSKDRIVKYIVSAEKADDQIFELTQKGFDTNYNFVYQSNYILNSEEHNNFFIPVNVYDSENNLVSDDQEPVYWSVDNVDSVLESSGTFCLSDGTTSCSMSTTNGFKLDIKKNSGNEPRNITVTLTYRGVTKTITITQNSKEEEVAKTYTIDVTPQTSDIPEIGGSQDFIVSVTDENGNVVSGVTVTAVSDNSTFVNPTSSSVITDDNGIAKFHIDVTANDSGYSRVANIGFYTPYGYTTSTITQNKVDAKLTKLNINPSSIDVGPEAGSINIVATVTDSDGNRLSGVNVSWAVTYDPDNSDVISPTTGSTATNDGGVANISVHISDNTSEDDRSATIVIYTGDDQADVVITQSGITIP